MIMPSCDLLESCYFHRNELSGMPCTYKALLYKYCLGEYTKCTRLCYARAHGKDNVPLEMFPNDQIAPGIAGRRRLYDQGNLS